MFAITQQAPGGPETLTWERMPDPTPGPNEVIIEIAASAVNRADVLQREEVIHRRQGAATSSAWSARAPFSRWALR